MQIGNDKARPIDPNGGEASRTLPMRRRGRILVCLAIMAALASVVVPGQQPRSPGMGQGYPSISSPSNQPPDANQRMLMHEQQAKNQNFQAANAERRKIIADESALLLKLATDLKTEVDKTSKDTLSLSIIRKADVIEKLARDVKEKMKLTVGTN